MLLNYGNKSGVYYTICSWAEKDIPKSAGFKWDPKGKCWFTKDESIACKLASYANDELKEKLEAVQKEKRTKLADSSAPTTDLIVPVPEGLKLFDFQRAAIDYIKDRAVALIGDQPGLGKTLDIIGLCNLKGYKKVLIVCPASLKWNWSRECLKWMTDKSLTVSVLSAGQSVPYCDWLIVNYDILVRYPELFDKEWDLVAFDESHKLKNQKAKRTKVALGLGKEHKGFTTKQLIFVTGTPVLNRPEELWTTLKTAGIFTDWMAFVLRYCAAKKTRFGWDTSGASNLDELNTMLREKIMVRRLKSDVLEELPAKSRRIISVEPSGTAKTVIERQKSEAGKKGFNLDELGSSSVQAIFATLAADRKALATEKVDVVAKYLLDALDEHDCLSLFAHHQVLLDAMEGVLIKARVKYSRVDYKVNNEERDRQVQAFQDGTTRVFLGSIGAAGVGITLTKANYQICAEPTWTPAELTQMEDRHHRIGQKNSVLTDYIVFKDSLDEYVLERVLAKGNIEERLLDS